MNGNSTLPEIIANFSHLSEITISSVTTQENKVSNTKSLALSTHTRDDATNPPDSDNSTLSDSFHKVSTLPEKAQTKESNVIPELESESSSAEYEIVALNDKIAKKPSVFAQKLNMQSSKATQGVTKRVCTIISSEVTKQSVYGSNEIDRSRVVVQVLTAKQQSELPSDTESIVECNTSPQTSSLCSFREDLFSILGKSKPSGSAASVNSFECNGNDSEASSLNDQANFCAPDNNNRGMNHKSKLFNKTNGYYKSRYQKYNQRKEFVQKKNRKLFDRAVPPNYYYYRLNSKKPAKERGIKQNQVTLKNLAYSSKNRGMEKAHKLNNIQVKPKKSIGKMLYEIGYIAKSIDKASSNLLRILHYVLFDTYGPCNSRVQFSQTKENILFFGGYSFDSSSEAYMKKKNCLMRLPFPILTEMYKVIIGKNNKDRKEIVSQLMDFFMQPSEKTKDCDITYKALSTEEYEYLKNMALRESPKVVLKKLTIDEVNDLKEQLKMNADESSNSAEPSDSEYFPPAYILKGPGKKLKLFPNIVKQVSIAKSSMIEALHYVLYGRCESKETAQRNILEFSGFLPCQKEFISQRHTLLNNMGSVELYYLCKILCLKAKTNSRSLRIKKVMKFLSKPSFIKRCVVFTTSRKPIQPTRSLRPFISKPEKAGFSAKKHVTGPKLRDFKQIRSNIECASPSDLTELNDLLFIKPCDESEIHQKILDFTQFDFSTASMEYHYRKTLMHYMSSCIIKKIAQQLAIENWENSTSQSDLSVNILNFLMDMKNSGTSSQKNLNFIPSAESYYSTGSAEKSNMNLLEIYEKKTEESWGFPDVSKSIKNQNSSSGLKPAKNSSIWPVERKVEDTMYLCHVYAHKVQNNSVTTIQKHVVIHRLTKSGEENSVNHINVHIPLKSIQNEEDSTPLRMLLHHPSDYELKEIINKIIKSDLFNLTLGKLVQKVYDFYPDLNISYRENFIKAQARLMLSQLRSNAVDTLNSLQCNLSDVI